MVSRRKRLRRYFSMRQSSLRVKAGVSLKDFGVARLSFSVKDDLDQAITPAANAAMDGGFTAPQGYYAASSQTPAPRPRLGGDVRADVCVIGGGFTGLTAALHLA